MRFSLTLASAVVNCHFTGLRSALRLASHAATSAASSAMSPKLLSRHCDDKAASSVPATFGQLPCLGVWCISNLPAWVVGAAVHLRHVLHRGYEGGVPLGRDLPVPADVRLNLVFLAPCGRPCGMPPRRAAARPASPPVGAPSTSRSPAAARSGPRSAPRRPRSA